MSRLETFVPPRPKRWMIRFAAGLNRLVMLRGIPGLRDIWPLSLVPGFRGLTDIRVFDLPAEDAARLKAVSGPAEATFITPNHPEFFTDWMIDKELLWRVAPMTAAWATHTVVNGMGPLMQRFWLANNLIAQIPGNSDVARQHSIEWAAKGYGVLLHPEGAVGWHADWVAPVMPGAVEMAAQALALGRTTNPAFRAHVAPVIWKLVFLRDAEAGLRKEARYVEGRLGIAPLAEGAGSAELVFNIYQQLTKRDLEALGVAAAEGLSLRQRVSIVLRALEDRLAAMIGLIGPKAKGLSRDELLRAARRWLRENKANPAKQKSREVKETGDWLWRVARLGDFAFRNPEISQEEIAEHLKRIRTDYCAGTLRDNLAKFLPQPVAPRRAIIRALEPIEIADSEVNVEATVAELRSRLQTGLDTLNNRLRGEGAFRYVTNPFHEG